MVVKKTNSKFPLKPYIVKKLVTCTKDQTVFEACNLMAEKNIGTIIIVDKKNKKKPIGIFTERDLVKDVIAKHIAPSVTLEDVMSKKVITANYTVSDAKIAFLMNENNVKKIVILKDKKLYGIITQTDMVKVLTDSLLK